MLSAESLRTFIIVPSSTKGMMARLVRYEEIRFAVNANLMVCPGIFWTFKGLYDHFQPFKGLWLNKYDDCVLRVSYLASVSFFSLLTIGSC